MKSISRNFFVKLISRKKIFIVGGGNSTMLEQEVENLRKEKEALLQGNEKLWRENENLKKEQEVLKEHAKDLKEKYSIQHTNCETFEMQQNILMNILDVPADQRNFTILKDTLENVIRGKKSSNEIEEWKEKFRQTNNSLAYQMGVNSTISSQISEIMTIMNVPPQDRTYEHLRSKLEHLKRQNINLSINSSPNQKQRAEKLARINENLAKAISELQLKFANLQTKQNLELQPEIKKRDSKILSLEQEIQRYQRESQNWSAVVAQQQQLMDIIEIPPQSRSFPVFQQKVTQMKEMIKKLSAINFANKPIMEDMNRKLVQANTSLQYQMGEFV